MRMKNAVGSAYKTVYDVATIEMLKESGWAEAELPVKADNKAAKRSKSSKK